MKRTLLITGILLSILAAYSVYDKSRIFVVHAQTLPIIRTVTWDANSPADNVTNYVVRLDSIVVGSPTGLTQPITITTAGIHTIAVRAVNLWGESLDTILTINVVVPQKPTNVRLQ